jgi:hypothetical protein
MYVYVYMYTVLIMRCRNEASLVVESFEIKRTMLLFIPEAGEFVVPRATCKLLLIVPVTNAGPHAVPLVSALHHPPAETASETLYVYTYVRIYVYTYVCMDVCKYKKYMYTHTKHSPHTHLALVLELRAHLVPRDSHVA